MNMSSEWKTVGVVFEGHPIEIEGINPWKFEWNKIAQTPTMLPHPSYPMQTHSYDIYEINVKDRKVVFAAGELSANVWGFYVRERND